MPIRPLPRKSTVNVVAKARKTVVLTGDIGGTNARFSVWEQQNGGPKGMKEVFSKTYPTSQFKTFDAAVNMALQESADYGRPQAAALAVAGAVLDNKCNMTNVSWVVDGPTLQESLDMRVAVLNDFEAVGYGVPVLSPEDYVTINDVPVHEKAPKIVMGPGTGLGAAQLMWDTGMQQYRVWPGEGSHGTFSPRGWKQQALAAYVTNKYGHCEIEQVACGSGLGLIYEFLLSDEVANRPDLLKAAKPKCNADITAAALDGLDPLAVECVDMFLAIVGAEAGQMALRCLAKGGVFIAGGVTPRMMARAKAGALLEGFVNRKVRKNFHDILCATPLFVITNEKVGALGACEFASSLLL